jgi:hypothetical protein
VTTILGLLGLVAYIVCIVAFAAAVTWVVVRLTPARRTKPAQPSSE